MPSPATLERSTFPAAALRLAATAALLLLAATTAPPLARAQMGMPDQPDLAITNAGKKAVVDSLAAALEARYVFPDVAKKTAAALRDRFKRGAYAGLDSAKAFGDSLSHDLRAIGKDHHFRVEYSYKTLTPDMFVDAPPTAEERARRAEMSRRLNYGFERVQRLAGNVGYLDLRMFDGSPDAGSAAMAAIALLNNTDALIVDLRRNGGGDPNMVTLLMSWLLSGDDRVHVNDFYLRDGDRTEQYFTFTTFPGKHYDGRDLYVLTSHRTGSCAEEFSYDVKNLKRGTLIGETTAGGANPGGYVRLNEHFTAFVSTGRAVNPYSKTNWEGVGVGPDVNVAADDALKTAHVTALQKLIDQATDPDRKAWLGRALQVAKDAPVEPLNLPPASPRAAVAK